MRDKSVPLYKISEDVVLRCHLTASQKARQDGISLIASENYPHLAAAVVLNTCVLMSNSEGYPLHTRGASEFYAGDEHAEEVQQEALWRAQTLFNCNHANVQPLSGSIANTAVINALTRPGDTILTATFESGAGHFTHAGEGHISRRGLNVANFIVDESGRIDHDDIRKKALAHKPKLIIVGGSGYPRQYDFAELGKIAKESGSLLMVDMAQIAGLVAASLHPSPFPHADVVTSSTHKTLGGVRAGFILWNDDELSKPINDAMFPGLQGEPDNAKIAASATIFYEARMPRYAEEMKRIVENAKLLASALEEKGLRLLTGGTDNHLMMIDLRPVGLDGGAVAKILHAIGIYSNKMPISEDKPGQYSGIRFGTCTITKRGFDQPAVRQLGNIIAEIVEELAQNKFLTDVTQEKLSAEVRTIAHRFPPPKFGTELGELNDAVRKMEGVKLRLARQDRSREYRSRRDNSGTHERG